MTGTRLATWSAQLGDEHAYSAAISVSGDVVRGPMTRMLVSTGDEIER